MVHLQYFISFIVVLLLNISVQCLSFVYYWLYVIFVCCHSLAIAYKRIHWEQHYKNDQSPPIL